MVQNIQIKLTNNVYYKDFIPYFFRELFKKANVDFPSFISKWTIDIASIYIDYGYDPNEREDFKEHYLGIGTERKHNALFDAQVAQKFFHKMNLFFF